MEKAASHISVVIPVYRAEECLHELYRRLVSALSTISKDFEILMIEDCGSDRSWDIICELSRQDPRVRGFRFSRNFGQHYGITAGIDNAGGEWVVVMDCDLQDRPEEIPRLYKKAQEGFDVVLALRLERKDSLFKRISSYLFFRLFRYLSGLDYNGDAGNFRIISRKVADCYRKMRENLRLFGALVTWMGFPTAAINVEHAERVGGKSSYTFRKLLHLAVDTIIAYSDKPLRVTVKFGLVISLIAFAFGIYFIVRTIFYNQPVAGWPSLIVSLYFLGGVIISILGIIGIYLGKVFDEVKGRPLYIIADRTDTT
ncbi:MAG: glycosyltransferase family 2 protein [Gammaproteobacteria bacterium]|nr:glycosyltransferase family 2 protein [Gammaproteobacteria bacterium]